jgi:hypothetical protein
MRAPTRWSNAFPTPRARRRLSARGESARPGAHFNDSYAAELAGEWGLSQ